MHSVLVAAVLAGGLAVGDGGGADPGRVGVDFGGDWEGTVSLTRADSVPTPVVIEQGRLRLRAGVTELPFRVTWAAEGKVTVRVLRRLYPGIYRLQGRDLYICFGAKQRPSSFSGPGEDTLLILHRPNAK